jgi:hypothetical protein
LGEVFTSFLNVVIEVPVEDDDDLLWNLDHAIWRFPGVWESIVPAQTPG